MQTEQITGLILAGGRGTRMGGADKGLQPFRQTTMVAEVLRRLSPQVGSVLINANRNQERYAAFGVRVVNDDSQDYQGPLAGVKSGLLACSTPYLLCVPCDAPFLPPDLAGKLRLALLAEDSDAAVALTVDDAGGHCRQPVFCLMKTSVLGSLQSYLASGARAVGAWHATLRTSAVLFSDAHAFRNINTTEELQAYETRGPNETPLVQS